jgi:hypothetical protein
MKLTDFLIGIGRPIAFYPGLKKVTKSTVATIFLCQLIYWIGKGELKDGGIYKTSEEIENETGLSYEEQKTARKKLVELHLLDEHYARLDHNIVFKVNMELLDTLWGASSQCHDGENGKPLIAKVAMPDSFNESETTTETTTDIKTSSQNLNSPEMIESILGIKANVKPKENLEPSLDSKDYKQRIQKAMDTGIENNRQRVLTGKFDCAHFPADIQETVQLVTDLWQIVPPGAKEPGFSDWIKSGRELQKACAEFGGELIKEIYDDWKKYEKPFTVSRPGSLIQSAISRAGVIRQAQEGHVLGEVNRSEMYEWNSSMTEEENLQRIEKMTGTKLTRNK